VETAVTIQPADRLGKALVTAADVCRLMKRLTAITALRGNAEACFGDHKNAHSGGVGVTILRKIARFYVGA
jgi:hypothetical protein